MSGDNGNGKITEGLEGQQEAPKEKVQTNQDGHLAKIRVGDQEYKVVNSCTMMEIVVHKLENGKEVSQVIAHEFMMTDHKPYMIHLLTDAINTVARARRSQPLIKTISEAAFNKLRRSRIKDIFRRRG